MASGPELFVVCKNCRSQVSPYITECPYCGQRLRKRAPKIEREGGPVGKADRRKKTPRPSLGPLRTGEIPGIRGDETSKPWATFFLVALGALWWLAFIPLEDEAVYWVIDPLREWWGVVLAPFLSTGGFYQFAALGSLALFGWLLERRHGPVVVIVVWLLAASGGMAIVKAVDPAPFAVGASGGALGLLCAWAVPVLLARRKTGDDDDESDMIGVAVIFVLLALMPAARDEVSPIATVSGALIGALCGLALARLSPRA